MKSNKFNKLGSLLLLVATSIFAIYMWNGALMITDDSRQYLTTAYNFYNHGELLTVKNIPLTAFPPLYALVLAFMFKFDQSIQSVILLQVCTFFVNGLILIYYYNRYLKNVWLKTAATALTLFSSFFVINHVFVWSEGIFYLLSILWFFATLRLYKRLNNFNILNFIIIATLLCMQRKTGVIFVATSLLFLMSNRVYWTASRLFKVFLSAFIGSVFTIFWRYRSTQISNKFMFDRNFSFNQTLDAVNQEFTELGSWIIPRMAPDWLKWIVVLAVVYFVVRYLREFELRKPVKLSIYLIVIYSLSIIGFMTFFKLSQTIDIRILGILSPFIFLVIAKSIENFLVFKHSKHHIYVLVICFIAVFCYNIVRTGINMERWRKAQQVTLQGVLKGD